MATTDINTHYGKNIKWTVYRNGYNAFVGNLTLDGVAYDISSRVFTAYIRTLEGSADKLTLTEGNGITNGGAEGTLTIALTEAQLATLPRDRYFIVVEYTISDKDYPLCQGYIEITDRTNPGITTTSATIPVDINGVMVNMAVTLAGGVTNAEVLEMVNDAVESAIASAEISADLTVNVDAYGAVGDGATDDTDAIQNAIDAAGQNGVVRFTDGKTYLLKGAISLPAGITIYGYGATLKRSNKITTTLSATAASGATSLTVADGSIFAIGDTILITYSGAPLGGVGYAESSMTANVPQTISNVSGNILTLSTGISLPGSLGGSPFPIGSTVVKVFPMMSAANGTTSTGVGNGFKIFGLVFDGNKANNDATYAWAPNRVIASMPWGSIVQHCTFKDIPNENIFPSRDCVIRDNIAYELNGSFCHISSSGEDPTGYGKNRIVNNVIINSMLQFAANGRTACITVSANSVKTYIEGNFIEGCDGAIYSVTGVSADEDAECYLFNNQCKDIQGIIYSRASNFIAKNIEISNNKFDDCHYLICEPNSTGTVELREGSGHKNIVFANNICRNVILHFSQCSDITIESNKLEYDSDYSFTAPSGFSGTPSRGINFTNCANVIINNNNIENRGTSTLTGAICVESGQSRASKVWIKSDASTNTVYAYFGRNFKIRGNLIIGFAYGIVDWNQAAISGFTVYNRERDFAFLGTDFTDNTIFLNEDASNVGIICGPGIHVIGNKVFGNANTSERGIMVFGVNDASGSGYTGTSNPETKIPGPIVTQNTVIGCTTSITVGHDPGGTTLGDNTYNAVVKYNYVSTAVTDSSGGDSTVSDNVTIVAAVPPLQLVRENPDFY